MIMQSEQFTVLNVKCAGCIASIQQGLAELEGVDEVQVRTESGEVTVSGDGLKRDTLAAKLAQLGYPEA